MDIQYGIATKDDIDELIRLRIAYMIDDMRSAEGLRAFSETFSRGNSRA